MKLELLIPFIIFITFIYHIGLHSAKRTAVLTKDSSRTKANLTSTDIIGNRVENANKIRNTRQASKFKLRTLLIYLIIQKPYYDGVCEGSDSCLSDTILFVNDALLPIYEGLNVQCRVTDGEVWSSRNKDGVSYATDMKTRLAEANTYTSSIENQLRNGTDVVLYLTYSNERQDNIDIGYAVREGKLCDGMVTILADANINRPDIHITHQFVLAFGIIGCNEPCNHCYVPRTGPPLYTRFQQPGATPIVKPCGWFEHYISENAYHCLEDGDDGLSIGSIIAIVLAVLAIITILSLLWWCLVYKKKNRVGDTETDEPKPAKKKVAMELDEIADDKGDGDNDLEARKKRKQSTALAAPEVAMELDEIANDKGDGENDLEARKKRKQSTASAAKFVKIEEKAEKDDKKAKNADKPGISQAMSTKSKNKDRPKPVKPDISRAMSIKSKKGASAAVSRAGSFVAQEGEEKMETGGWSEFKKQQELGKKNLKAADSKNKQKLIA